MAVTLPTSSYSPSSSFDGDEMFMNTNGSTVRGSFSMLGTGAYDACAPGEDLGYTTSFETCEDCCKDAEPDKTLRADCINYCYGGQAPLSPLDPSTWFIIMFSAFVLLTGCIRALKRKNA
ncbi:MAG: hypothetical protein IJP50_03660 [Paludibacteraceae bacterium]|nr:hypothetical protein [Paludibacteraceae bacterium]